MSSCLESEFILVKSSPLVHLMKTLYDKFPGVESEAIDKIIIRTKCNVEAAEEEINSLVSRHSALKGTVGTDSWTEWFDKDTSTTGAFAKREMKVYRLDPENSPKKLLGYTMELDRLMEDPKFKNLTVEEAIKYLGEQEKARIREERDRVVRTLETKLKDSVAAMNSKK